MPNDKKPSDAVSLPPPPRIVDAHVHLWDPKQYRIRWIDTIDTLHRSFTPRDYAEHTAGLNIESMVYLQVDVDPAYGLLEARDVAERLASQDPRIQGVVAYAPLEDGECVRSYLEALSAIGPKVKGVRRLLQGDRAELCLEPGFVTGVRALAEFGLSFDLCITYQQLPNVIKLVQACPNVSFMLDHIGKPDIANGEINEWRAGISGLAKLENVSCKVSGVITEAKRAAWTVADIRPYVEHVLGVFGPGRVAFGCDWPVVTLAGPYRAWVDALNQITQSLSAEHKSMLWADNARTFYRL